LVADLVANDFESPAGAHWVKDRTGRSSLQPRGQGLRGWASLSLLARHGLNLFCRYRNACVPPEARGFKYLQKNWLNHNMGRDLYLQVPPCG
jgi:hypothetical protein